MEKNTEFLFDQPNLTGIFANQVNECESHPLKYKFLTLCKEIYTEIKVVHGA